MYEVLDKDRRLKFDGIKLAQSSSYSHGRTRWVEFELYRTSGGQYVLSRIGVSLFFHSAGCAVVTRNKIKPIPATEIPSNLIPCTICQPVESYETELFPETARYWAQVCTSPECVIESLYKYDENDARYLTNVARHLLAEAASRDEGIADIFFNEHIA